MRTLINLSLGLWLSVSLLNAQSINLTWEQYDALKAAGALPAEFHLDELPVAPPAVDVQVQSKGGGGTGGNCDCWVTPDASYTTINNATQWNASGFGNGDDGSYGPVNLPFSFNLYGQTYNTAYININGNVSFGNYITTYSSSAFPSTGNVMVAPFWADVDLRGGSAGQNVACRCSSFCAHRPDRAPFGRSGPLSGIRQPTAHPSLPSWAMMRSNG